MSGNQGSWPAGGSRVCLDAGGAGTAQDLLGREGREAGDTVVDSGTWVTGEQQPDELPGNKRSRPSR